jgi:hypothetical protein
VSCSSDDDVEVEDDTDAADTLTDSGTMPETDAAVGTDAAEEVDAAEEEMDASEPDAAEPEVDAETEEEDAAEEVVFCDPNPCENGGSCVEIVNSYQCQCADGYTGRNCEYEASGCIELHSSYEEDITLDAGCYIAKSDVTVYAKMTIEAGAWILFQQDVGMSIRSDGALVAIGTEENPVGFSGERALRGYWNGLELGSNSVDNQLDFVIIEYGGGEYPGNLVLESSSSFPVQVDITNSTFRQSEGYGLVVRNHSTINTFNNNTITENELGAAMMHPNTVGDLDDTTTYAENDKDIVLIQAGSVDEDQSWPAIDADYLVEGDITVYEALTIYAGARILFQQDLGMSIRSGASLVAVGTEELPILFSGEGKSRGYWNGLSISSNSVDNKLEYVTIEYGGGADTSANLVLNASSSFPVQIDIVNCTLRESQEYGLSVTNHTTINSFSDNTLTENQAGAAIMHPNTVGDLDDTSTYIGNDEDIVLVEVGSVDDDQSWPGIDADYLIDGDITVYGNMTIEAGARLVFKQDIGMYVRSDASLAANGTSSAPIVMTGEQQTRGYWGGLEYNSNSVDNALTYVTIEYAGGQDYDANLVLDGSSSFPVQLNATDCVFQQSAGCGVFQTQHVTVNSDFDSANTFADNDGADICTP